AAKVKVDAGLFADKGYLVGQVFADCDGNGLRDKNEAGIPGVRIWLEDGSFAQTDADGRYSFADLSPHTHAARLDQLTLPQGAVIARNAANRFVDLQDGQLGKADFAIDACSPQLLDAIKARRTTLQASNAAAERAASSQAVAPAAAAATDVSKLDNSLGFVGLQDGAVMPHALATIRVKGTAGARFELDVNGKTVGMERVGQRSTVAERQLESWEFVGVTLNPGRNRLALRQFDSFGNPRGASTLEVIAPGEAKTVRLELDKATQAADGRSLTTVRVHIEDANGVPVTERTPVTLVATRGSWEAQDLDAREPGMQAFVEGGSAQFALRAPNEAGDAALTASSGALRGEAAVNFVPAQRPLLATGVIDAAVGLGRSSGNTVRPSRTFDSLDDTLRGLSAGLEDRHAAASGRAAAFMKGTVAGDTLLTMSYDTDKPKQDAERRLFRDLDPNAYYPTYGDDAVRGFEAQSAGRLYLRAERNKSYVAYGDFTPANGNPARKLGAYQRSLTGLRQHLETGALVVDSFASYDSTRQLVEEIAANGTSGPYLTGSGAMVINSERVEIVTRERNRDGVIVASRPMVRYVDYDVEPLTGRILFRAPVASLDADLNPQYVRISYEVDQGNPNFWVAGVSAQYRVGPRLEVGAAVATDRNPAQTQTLSSVNATVKPDDKTTVIVEAARMDRAGKDLGRAARIDAVRVDGALESRVFYGRADENFDNASANLPRGRLDAGARLRYRVGERATVDLEALHTADAITKAERNGVLVGGGYAFAGGVRVEAGVRHAREQAPSGAVVAQPALTSVRMKVAAQIPNLPQAGVFVEAEQDVKDAGRRLVALGGDYRFAGGSRAYARHELISSLGSNYALNDSQQRNATVIGLDSDYMQNGRVFSEYRARAGGSDGGLGERQAEAAIGLRNLWQLGEGVRAHTSFERVRVLSGSQANEAVAVTGAVEISRSPVWKGTARLELRHAQDSDNVLSTLGLARRLDAEWSLLAKNTVSASRSRANDTLRLNELGQAGVAFRALETLGWNGLAKYEYKVERDTGAEQVERAVHMVAANANWQPTRETLFSARIAAKLARDRSLGLDSRNSAQLLGVRATHMIAKDWDVGASAQVLLDGGAAKGRQFGAGVEAGYRLRDNIWVSAGYNLLGFRERDLAGADATQKGVYLRLRMKFDERLLEGLLAPAK
ncbi:SdrD B-like domain-containing protein, partial [uncultured Massilia sp.]|uniref:SdrD B-like domain-containing protein n=1 Tax=uncultured Massilia sp. TaxID=169973 RepID=UPI002583C3C4